MSPFSGGVLGGAAVLSAPALWASLVVGTAPVADGLLRYIGAVAICWVGLSVVAALVGPAPRPPAGQAGAEPAAGAGESPGGTAS
jgi:threonine/homoserine/homoserine lactone efflux protein